VTESRREEAIVMARPTRSVTAAVLFLAATLLAKSVDAQTPAAAPNLTASGAGTLPLFVTVRNAQKQLAPALVQNDFEVLDNEKPLSREPCRLIGNRARLICSLFAAALPNRIGLCWRSRIAWKRQVDFPTQAIRIDEHARERFQALDQCVATMVCAVWLSGGILLVGKHRFCSSVSSSSPREKSHAGIVRSGASA
jgi:hypothetical protein